MQNFKQTQAPHSSSPADSNDTHDTPLKIDLTASNINNYNEMPKQVPFFGVTQL